jgi:hypothetical protein
MAQDHTSEGDRDSPVISMRIKFNSARSRRIAGVLLLTIACGSMAEAAEKVRWEDLPKRIRKQSNRDFVVVTKDGARFRGRDICFGRSDLRLSCHDIPDTLIAREDVSQIVIRQKGRYSGMVGHGSEGLANALWHAPGLRNVFGFLFFDIPAVLAWVGAEAAVLLPMEGVARLVPAKVFEVVQ